MIKKLQDHISDMKVLNVRFDEDKDVYTVGDHTTAFQMGEKTLNIFNCQGQFWRGNGVPLTLSDIEEMEKILAEAKKRLT